MNLVNGFSIRSHGLPILSRTTERNQNTLRTVQPSSLTNNRSHYGEELYLFHLVGLFEDPRTVLER